MLVRGTGIRDITAIEKISIKKVLSAPVDSRHPIQPEQQYYDCLEVDELWTYMSKKSRKVWLIYAYHRETGKIVAFVWGKCDLKTVGKLKKKLSDSGENYGSIATDDRDSFITVFRGENHSQIIQFATQCTHPVAYFIHRITSRKYPEQQGYQFIP
jgi:IS1 family transposase